MKKTLMAVLRFLRNLLRPNIYGWVVAIVVYVVWNVCNYVWGSHTDNYYRWYYMMNGLFIVLSFWSIAGLLPDRLKKFRWILNALTWVAIWKMIYTDMIVTGLVEESTLLSITGTLFVIVTGIIVLKWPK